MSALAYEAVPIVIDVVAERLSFARELGVNYTIHSAEENLTEKVLEYTNGRMAELVMECSGANPAVRSAWTLPPTQAGLRLPDGRKRRLRSLLI